MKNKTAKSKRDRYVWSKGQSPATRHINNVFETVMFTLRGFMLTCAKHDNPMRCLTYRVLDNGETKCHVTYRRVGKPISHRATAMPQVVAKLERQRRGGKKATKSGVTAGETAKRTVKQ